ncbi:MAG TPA: tRNA (guanosine(46)-N7)-methyltransferase TrmB [Verrucomicrobiae bacterium]
METTRVSQKSECPVLILPASYVERLNPGELFPQLQPVEVELGSGDGSFIAQWAALNPRTNFLAIERLLGRLRKIERKARRTELTNLRAMRLEASYFAQYLLPPQSVSAFHIYFPDPWPKRKHRANRLINERFTEVLRAALYIDGIVHVRTDDLDYFSQMTGVLEANGNFEAAPTPEGLARVLTDFERSFNAEGIQTNRAAFRRVR